MVVICFEEQTLWLIVSMKGPSMAQIKIYGLREHLAPLKKSLSDTIHACAIEALHLPPGELPLGERPSGFERSLSSPDSFPEMGTPFER
jgi:hypothetical protein